MKTMKKFLTVLLTAVTVFSLAACGSKKTEETAAETKAAEKTAAESGEATEAARRAEAALEACIRKGTGWIGKNETDFQAELVYQLTTRGVPGGGGIVAVGANAAVPHHHTGSSIIEDGKCLLIDFGGTYENYQSDMTRTYHFGEPGARFREVYEIVLESNLAGRFSLHKGRQKEKNMLQYRKERGARWWIPYI